MDNKEYAKTWWKNNKDRINKNRRKTQRKTTEERFWEHVKIGKEDECWEWDRPRKNNYGTFYIKKKSYIASRFSYELHKGKIPKGLFVCHSCDNPPCVNPNHLWLGTAKDNTQDCIKKGRHPVQTQREKILNNLLFRNKNRNHKIKTRLYNGGYKYSNVLEWFVKK